MKAGILLLIFLLTAGAFAGEITVCIINPNLENNPSYYHLPSTNSSLICGQQGQQTLLSMYKQGWHLITVVNVDPRYTAKGGAVPSPALYFER